MAQSARPSLDSDICISWLSSYAFWADFDFSSRSCVRRYLCSLMCTSKGLLVSPLYHQPQSHGMLNRHCFICRTSLTGPIFISVPRSVCLVFKMILTLKRFPMHLNFSDIPLTYGILWWTEWRRGRFPPSTSVSPAKFIPPIAPKNHLHHHHHHHQSIIGDMCNRPNGQTSMAAVRGTNKTPRDLKQRYLRHLGT
jgi:hypothetical protein